MTENNPVKVLMEACDEAMLGLEPGVVTYNVARALRITVEALVETGKMPCITELLGDDLGRYCGCASCLGKQALARAAEEVGK